jgi:hypothetical protein
MKNRTLILFLLIHLIFPHISYSQQNSSKNSNKESSALFIDNQQPLLVQLKFSINNVKKNTNDSTYVLSTLFYKSQGVFWDSLKIKIRARGNHRRETCYYVPLKLKLKKSSTKGTLFEGSKKLKLVLPCLPGKSNSDLIIKEYLAYKLYEIISPYHFKTRLVNIEFFEEKGKRIKKHELKGILIEDIDKVANRFNGRAYKRYVHPLENDAITSIQNNLFQYLIGNTDFSTRTQHNQKLLFIDNKFICIPYDFDMSGLVNANYAAVSGIENMPIKITEVTQRLYKGYKRDELLLQKVRQEFISHKIQIFNTIDDIRELFSDPKQFLKAKQYIADFFEIIESDKKFNKNMVSRTRTK